VKPLVFHPEAEAEFLAAIAWYEQQRAGLGGDFRDAVEAATRQIQQTPQVFTPHGNQGARKCLVRGFPYTIFFVELDQAIWIAAVAHQKRRPNYWASRTPD
jgi:toxin ParE1/3/4